MHTKIEIMENKSMERPLLGSVVRQKIDNGMLCLSDLSSIYEHERIKNGWAEKRLHKFFNNIEEIEYITELLELQGVIIKGKKCPFVEQAKNQGLIKALKEIGQYQTGGRGSNKTVYCNPYIFIAIAQWLNPKFRAYVTIWVTDQLILNRIDAGVKYNTLCNAINEYILPSLDSDNSKKFIYSNFGKLVNKKVFGKHDSNLRQIANKRQLSELKDVEVELSTLIKVGHIKSYSEAKEYLKL